MKALRELSGSKDDQLQTLKWLEPKWSYRPRIEAELSKVLDVKMWLRVVVVVILVAVILANLVERKFHDVEFNWVLGVAASIAAGMGLLAFQFIALWLPPSITISREGIFRTTSSTRIRRRAEIREIAVDSTNRDRLRLIVEAPARRLFECGVAQTVTLEELLGFLRVTFPELRIREVF